MISSIICLRLLVKFLIRLEKQYYQYNTADIKSKPSRRNQIRIVLKFNKTFNFIDVKFEFLNI